jgi:hypothetical protein
MILLFLPAVKPIMRQLRRSRSSARRAPGRKRG